MGRIEAALRNHVDDVVLQTKGSRALASGVQWPQDVQEKAGYTWRRAVELTKIAMSNHPGNAELQIATLEGLAKYLDKCNKDACKQSILESGGEDLIKAGMTQHVSDAKVQICGRIVLKGLGLDSSWTPPADVSAKN